MAAWTLNLTSERQAAVLEAIKEPGAGLEAVVTEETSALGIGYRESSLSREHGAYGDREGLLRAGDRAPDDADARLFETFAGPHFTLLGFGPSAAPALAAAAAKYGDAVRTLPVGSAGARASYGIMADALVLVRPDNHIGLIAPAADELAVPGYLDGCLAGPAVTNSTGTGQ